MRKTCITCGLIYPSSVPRKLKVCPSCFIKHVNTALEAMLPYLYELTDTQLIELTGTFNVAKECFVIEHDRRIGYVSALRARIGVN